MLRRSKARSAPPSEAQTAYELSLSELDRIKARTPEAQRLARDIQEFQKTPYFLNHVYSIIRHPS